METTTQHQAPDPTRWLESYGDYLYRYALVRVRDTAVAEDLVQETLLAAIGSRYGGRSSERTWLAGIMKHKTCDYFRRVARTPEFASCPNDGDRELVLFERTGTWQGHWREDCAPLSWPPNTLDPLDSRKFWETFDRCLARLPRQMAIAFTLREIDRLSTEDICEILNVSPNNLWVILHRSRAKLRELLEAEWFRGCEPSPPANEPIPRRGQKTPSNPEYSYRSLAV